VDVKLVVKNCQNSLGATFWCAWYISKERLTGISIGIGI